MSAITFDTLAYARKLETAGFTREQAEAQAEAQKEAIQEIVLAQEFATKKDILAVKKDILEAKHDLIKWVIGAMIGQTALLVAVIAFMK